MAEEERPLWDAADDRAVAGVTMRADQRPLIAAFVVSFKE